MVYPTTPLIANLFMEEFESKAIRTATNLPRLWHRYVGDIFFIHQAGHSHQLLKQINFTDPRIQFTMTNPMDSGFLPFLDTLVSLGPNNTLTTTVYRKPAHMGQDLHWNSHCNLLIKFNVFNTLSHRARLVCSEQHMLKEEEDHIREALLRYNYSTWELDRL